MHFDGSASKSNVSIDKYKSNESASIALKPLTLSTASNSCPLIEQAACSHSKPKKHDYLGLEYDDFLGENNKNKDDKACIHITESLSKWAVRFNISHVALCALLIILKANKLDIPLEARILLATPKKSEIITVAGGQYYHFGISNMLCVALKISKNSTAFLAQNTSSLTLRINIDGIPLANSVETCLWLILAVIKEIPEVRVFMGGVYHGATQSDSLKDYLHNFLIDLKRL